MRSKKNTGFNHQSSKKRDLDVMEKRAMYLSRSGARFRSRESMVDLVAEADPIAMKRRIELKSQRDGLAESRYAAIADLAEVRALADGASEEVERRWWMAADSIKAAVQADMNAWREARDDDTDEVK